MGRKKHKQNCSNRTNNTNNDINNMTEEDIESLRLLGIQTNAILLDFISDIFSYMATMEGIDIILNRYRENPIREPNPDIPALQSVYFSLASTLLFTKIGFSKYNILYEKALRGEIDYSLEPNANINLSNIFSIISYYYAVNGAQGIFIRDMNQPIFGL